MKRCYGGSSPDKHMPPMRYRCAPAMVRAARPYGRLLLSILLVISSNCTLAADRLAGFAHLGCGTPQIGIFGDTTTLLVGHIYYRRGLGPWRYSALDFTGAHALTRLPNGRWLVADTDNRGLVELGDLGAKGNILVRAELAGIKLKRPHFVLVAQDTGYIYVIAGERRLFRFRDLSGRAEVWTFSPDELGYARALAWFDHALHIIDSSRGDVLRIDNFEKHRYTRFRSPRPQVLRGLPSSQISPGDSRDDFDAGSLSTTGLILNDVEKDGDWYYGSNDFLVKYASGGDTQPGRLIRWRNWTDFEGGHWQDLSAYIPDSATPAIPLHPYFLTIYRHMLYAPLNGDDDDHPCEAAKILQLDLDTLSTR